MDTWVVPSLGYRERCCDARGRANTALKLCFLSLGTRLEVKLLDHTVIPRLTF